MKTEHDIRPSALAGQWYPADPRRLASSVDSYIQAAHLPALPGEVVAVMAPHAGHRYSGPVAGYAFAALRGLMPEVVAVISPMHDYTQFPLLTSAHRGYETPLGVVEIDRPRLQRLDEYLTQQLGVGLKYVVHDPEHALEIELPFLQRALGGPFYLLPVMVRNQSPAVVRALAKGLVSVLSGVSSLLVASTDLSHFYTQEQARHLDQAVLERVAGFDPEAVLHVEDKGEGYACGRGALAAVLWAAQGLGATQAQVLHYATSGDVTGDYDRVVGYGAAVFTRPVQKMQE